MSTATGCTTLVALPWRDGTNGFCMERQFANMARGGIFLPASAGTRFRMAMAIAAVLATMLAMPSRASDRWFTVELIVFDDLRNDGLHAEHWPVDPGEPPLHNTIELTDWPAGEAGGTAHAFRIVKRSELSLNAVWNRLRGSAHYRPFLHLGWRLPGLSQGAARPAHVSPHLGRSSPGTAASVGGERPAAHGTVKVSLARYLRVEIDLVYQRPASGEADPSSPAPDRFRIISMRRMRSGELHYFDHPLFGVLMRVSPL